MRDPPFESVCGSLFGYDGWREWRKVAEDVVDAWIEDGPEQEELRVVRDALGRLFDSDPDESTFAEYISWNGGDIAKLHTRELSHEAFLRYWLDRARAAARDDIGR